MHDNWVAICSYLQNRMNKLKAFATCSKITWLHMWSTHSYVCPQTYSAVGEQLGELMTTLTLFWNSKCEVYWLEVWCLGISLSRDSSVWILKQQVRFQLVAKFFCGSCWQFDTHSRKWSEFFWGWLGRNLRGQELRMRCSAYHELWCQVWDKITGTARLGGHHQQWSKQPYNLPSSTAYSLLNRAAISNLKILPVSPSTTLLQVSFCGLLLLFYCNYLR